MAKGGDLNVYHHKQALIQSQSRLTGNVDDDALAKIGGNLSMMGTECYLWCGNDGIRSSIEKLAKQNGFECGKEAVKHYKMWRCCFK